MTLVRKTKITNLPLEKLYFSVIVTLKKLNWRFENDIYFWLFVGFLIWRDFIIIRYNNRRFIIKNEIIRQLGDSMWFAARTKKIIPSSWEIAAR